MSGELAGPLQRVYFNDLAPRYYDLPRNTLDLRYEACAAHRTACDCREALINEAFGEHMAEIRAMETAILAAVSGHRTWAWTPDGWPDEYSQCKCQACTVARAARVGRVQCMQETRENEERLSAEMRRRDRHYYDLDEVPF